VGDLVGCDHARVASPARATSYHVLAIPLRVLGTADHLPIDGALFYVDQALDYLEEVSSARRHPSLTLQAPIRLHIHRTLELVQVTSRENT
jgi:hypothetical protein